LRAAPVRLAILPLQVEGDPIPSAPGIAVDIATRVGGMRGNFLIIPALDIARNKVEVPQQAKAVLGATHALETKLKNSNGWIEMLAQVVDLSTRTSIHEVRGTYDAKDPTPLAKALTATIAAAFHASSPPETVSPAAYRYYVQGIALLTRDNLSAAEAIPLFKKTIELDPRSALGYAGLAEAQVELSIRSGDRALLDSAGDAITKAKSLNGDSVPVLLISGRWNRERSLYDKSIQDYSRATEIDPSNADAWQRLANTHLAADHVELAESTYKTAIQVQPQSYRPYLDFGAFYYARARYREAEELFRKVTALAPALPTGHSNLGGVLMSLGRFPEADQELLEALRLKKTVAVLSNLGALYNLQCRYVEALKMFEEAQALGQPGIVLYSNFGYTYRHLHRAADAAEAYRKGLALAEQEITVDPKRAGPRANLALFAVFLQDRKRAAFEIGQALALAPGNAAVLSLAAMTYEALGERDKTLAVLQTAPGFLLASLNREPDLEDLQKDPRFVELVTKRPAL